MCVQSSFILQRMMLRFPLKSSNMFTPNHLSPVIAVFVKVVFGIPDNVFSINYFHFMFRKQSMMNHCKGIYVEHHVTREAWQ